MVAVSICIPTYNQTNYLRKTLDSITAQNFKDYEVIITDDSTNDSVEKLINSYRSKLPLKYFRNSSRLGSPTNWNQALKLAQGKYLKIMHHDDWFAGPDSLQEFIRPLEANPTIQLAYSSTIVSNNQTERLHTISFSEQFFLNLSPYYLLLKNIIGAPSSMIFRNNHNLSFSEKYEWLVDVAFYISILIKDPRIFYIHKPLVFTTMSSHNISNKFLANPRLIDSEYKQYFKQHKTRIPAFIKILLYMILFIKRIIKWRKYARSN